MVEIDNQQNQPPSITVSPFDDPPNDTYDADMSSLPNNLERPSIGHARNSMSCSSLPKGKLMRQVVFEHEL